MNSKNLKRLLALLLVLAMAFSLMTMLTACGEDEDEDEDDKKTSDKDDDEDDTAGKNSYYVVSSKKYYYGSANAEGKETEFSYKNGRLRGIDDNMKFKYNDKGQLITVEYEDDDEDDPFDSPVYTFTWENDVLVTIQEEEDGKLCSTWEFFHEDGKLVQMILIEDDDKCIATYDDWGNLLEKTWYENGSDDYTSKATYTNTYDEDGNLIKVEMVNSRGYYWFEYEYDENGNLAVVRAYDSYGYQYHTTQFTYEQVKMTKAQYQIYRDILTKFLES